MQVTRLIAQQPVTLGNHLVPVAAACEPTAGAARRDGTKIRLALLPFCVVLQLTGAIEPPDHLLLPIAALLHRLKVWEAQIGQDLALPTISTTKIAGTLRKAGLVHCFCPGLGNLRRRGGGQHFGGDHWWQGESGFKTGRGELVKVR
jgi:hypothetical protein